MHATCRAWLAAANQSNPAGRQSAHLRAAAWPSQAGLRDVGAHTDGSGTGPPCKLLTRRNSTCRIRARPSAQTGDAQAAMKPIKSKVVADGLFDGAYRMASLWLWKSEGFWKAALEHVDCGLPIPPWWGRAHGRYSSCAEPGLANPKKVVHNAGFLPEGCPKNLLWIKKLSRKRAFVSRSVLQGKLRLPFFIARVGCSLDWPIRIGSVAHLRGPGYA